MKHPAPRPPFLARLVFSVPLLGWMLREIYEQREGALGWFTFSLVGFVVMLAMTFGLVGLVIGMLLMTFVMFCVILSITAGRG
jgi:hypothetical protein